MTKMCHANASGYSVCNFINVDIKCLSMLVKRAKDKTYGKGKIYRKYRGYYN